MGTFIKKDFLNFAKIGDADSLKAVLSNCCVDYEVEDSSGKTALMLAAENGHLNVLNCLLTAGIKPNVKHGRSGKTALHFAAESGQDECVLALIQAGAFVNMVDTENNTPLLLTMKKYSKYSNTRTFQVVKHLIDAGCEVNKQDIEKCTALHYATYKAIGTELLLSAGANPNIQDEDGNSPLHIAAIEGFDAVVRCLTTYNCNPNLINCRGSMAIHTLAMKGHADGIDDIIHCGGYLDHADNSRRTPLFYAVTYNRVEAVRVLLKGNCHPDSLDLCPVCTDDTNNTSFPIEEALSKKYFAIAKMLLLAGCNLSAVYSAVNVYKAFLEEQEEISRNPRQLAVQDLALIKVIADDEHDAMKWFSNSIKYPPQLRQLCRIRIRACIRPKPVFASLELLGIRLPNALKDFINLKELDDM